MQVSFEADIIYFIHRLASLFFYKDTKIWEDWDVDISTSYSLEFILDLFEKTDEKNRTKNKVNKNTKK